MQVIWNVAPWMRRRAQRHLERGSSAKLIHYILTHSNAESGRSSESTPPANEPAADNIILFRTLKASP